jgi:hypothetical protein
VANIAANSSVPNDATERFVGHPDITSSSNLNFGASVLEKRKLR